MIVNIAKVLSIALVVDVVQFNMYHFAYQAFRIIYLPIKDVKLI